MCTLPLHGVAADRTLLGDLQVGDEILSVNGEDFREMSRCDAWNRLKEMPQGTLNITVNRHHQYDNIGNRWNDD